MPSREPEVKDYFPLISVEDNFFVEQITGWGTGQQLRVGVWYIMTQCEAIVWQDLSASSGRAMYTGREYLRRIST